MNTKRKINNLFLVAIFLIFLSMAILVGRALGKMTAYANSSNLFFEEQRSTELETNDPEAYWAYEGSMDNSTIMATSNSLNNPNSTDGKRIANNEKITRMTMFPEHDGNNGCGMVRPKLRQGKKGYNARGIY